MNLTFFCQIRFCIARNEDYYWDQFKLRHDYTFIL